MASPDCDAHSVVPIVDWQHHLDFPFVLVQNISLPMEGQSHQISHHCTKCPLPNHNICNLILLLTYRPRCLISYKSPKPSKDPGSDSYVFTIASSILYIVLITFINAARLIHIYLFIQWIFAHF